MQDCALGGRHFTGGIDAFDGLGDFGERCAGGADRAGASRLEVEFVLKKAKVRGMFTAVVSADDVKNGKPHPESFLTALKVLNQFRLVNSPEIQPGECLVIEDSYRGVAAAKTAGMKAAAVTTSYSPEELKDANLIIESLVGLEVEKLERLFV